MLSRNQLKIIVATGIYPSRRHPARGVFLERDVHGLVERKHEVLCLIARNALRERLGTTRLVDGLEVREARALSLSNRTGWERVLGALAQRNTTNALNRLYAKSGAKPQIVYAKFLNAAPFLAGIAPIAARVLGLGEGLSSIQYRLANWPAHALGQYLRTIDLVEVKNSEVSSWLAANYGVGDKIRVVPSGVDTAYFTPGERKRARALLNIDLEAFVVVSVGSRNTNKGGERLLAAARSCNDARIVPVFVGSGWNRNSREDFIGFGSVPPATVRLALQAADAFCLPSLSEGMPNALLEALACGLPCIVGDGSYSAFLAHFESCLKVDAASVEDIARALMTLRDSEDLRKRIGMAGLRIAEACSQESRISRLEALFQEAMNLKDTSA